MPGYICLFKFTPKGIQELKSIPELLKQSAATTLKEMGMRRIGMWVTMGEYDAVAIYEAPDDLTMAAAMMVNARNGLTTSQTMRALSEEEFAQVVSKLP